MAQYIRTIFVAFLFACLATVSGAQEDSVLGTIQDALAERAARSGEETIDTGIDDTPVMPELPASFVADPETLALMQSSVQAYYRYHQRSLDHRSRVFEWRHFSTRAIFFVVIAIVLIGLYFSWIQFKAEGHSSTPSTLEASGKGIKVTSSVLGVVILALSLIFFYLYLVYVYPISEIF